MLHTPPTPVEPPAPPSVPLTHVRCRARTWRVVGAHGTGDAATWHLAQGAEVPRLIACPPDAVLAIPARRRQVSRRPWTRAVLAHARQHAPAWWPATATSLPVDALPWQFVPAMMLLSGHHRRLLLADEVGMGKTVQAGVALHEIHAREPDAASLVVAPAGLVPQWVGELRLRAQLEPSVLDAAALRREASLPQATVDAARAGSCWLISIDLLRQPDVVSLLTRTRWTLLVVDEAHGASPTTARFAAVSRVATASVRVLLLTATPTAAGAAGAESLRDIGRRAGERPMAVVRREASLLARPRRRTCLLRVDLGTQHAALCAGLDRFVERARSERGGTGLLPALVLRRRAASCPAALRRSLERRLDVLGESAPAAAPILPGLFDDPSADQDGLDDELMRCVAWADVDEERAELRRLLERCRLLPPAGRKLQCVARLARRARQPIVIFTAFLDTLRALRALLPADGLAVVHGDQPEALRSHALSAFTSGDASVLLATDAAAEGLNLHARCRLVVHAEVPASARILQQRIGRLDRYGQHRRVHAVVIGSGTREDVEALARLRTRAADGEQWVSAVAQSRCRRTAVAARQLAVHGRHAPADASPAPEGDSGVIVTCKLRPRRWRRLVRRCGLPVDTGSVRAATLRVTGGPELSAARFIFVAAGPPSWMPPWPTAVAKLPLALQQQVRRAMRLARRLEAWERAVEAAIAAAATATAPSRDLFSDAGEVEARSAPHPQAPLWVSVEDRALISCRVHGDRVP